jgi:hypothetical protein
VHTHKQKMIEIANPTYQLYFSRRYTVIFPDKRSESERNETEKLKLQIFSMFYTNAFRNDVEINRLTGHEQLFYLEFFVLNEKLWLWSANWKFERM